MMGDTQVECPVCHAYTIITPEEAESDVISWWCQQCNFDVSVNKNGAQAARPTRHVRKKGEDAST